MRTVSLAFLVFGESEDLEDVRVGVDVVDRYTLLLCYIVVTTASHFLHLAQLPPRSFPPPLSLTLSQPHDAVKQVHPPPPFFRRGLHHF